MNRGEVQQKEPVEDVLDAVTDAAFTEVSKWTRRIAVIGFAIGAFVVMVMLFNGADILKTVAASLPAGLSGGYPMLVGLFFVLFFSAAIVFFSLYRASQLLLQGVREKDKVALAESFVYLKRFFVATIVVAVFQIVGNLFNLL